jgi:hypothetical protein
MKFLWSFDGDPHLLAFKWSAILKLPFLIDYA